MTARPLAGRTVVITRRPEQGQDLGDSLRELGARVLELPAIEVRRPADAAPLEAALTELSSFDWLLFTSANAVKAVAERLGILGLSPEFAEPPPKVAVVGEATARALRDAFPRSQVTLDPGSDSRAAGLLEALRSRNVAGGRVLLPASSRARDQLPEGLRAAGAEVVVVEAYQTVDPPGLLEALEPCLEARPDLFVFASPSAVRNLALAAGGRLRGWAAVVIGPTTQEAALAAGLEVRAVAAEPSTAGLAAAVTSCLGRPQA